jgi:hypothetical protein
MDSSPVLPRCGATRLPSPTFSPAFCCKAEYACSYSVFRPNPSSPYFEYACGGCGCHALYLQASSAFRGEVGEKVGLAPHDTGGPSEKPAQATNNNSYLFAVN